MKKVTEKQLERKVRSLQIALAKLRIEKALMPFSPDAKLRIIRAAAILLGIEEVNRGK